MNGNNEAALVAAKVKEAKAQTCVGCLERKRGCQDHCRRHLDAVAAKKWLRDYICRKKREERLLAMPGGWSFNTRRRAPQGRK